MPALVTVLVAPAFIACATSQSAESARTPLAAVIPAATPEAAPDTGSAPPGVLTAQPIEPVLAGPLEIGALTPQSATLNITTSRDLACVVVFGMDPGFGQLALDQQMGSRAHRDHRVVMRGLRPDTESTYRLRGSDPDGTFYVDAYFSERRNARAAQIFFPCAIEETGVRPERVATDKAKCYPPALRAVLPGVEHRSSKYLNNGVERDHEHLKQRLYPMRGFKQAASATITVRGHARIRNLRTGFSTLTCAVPLNLRLAVAWPQLARAI